MTDYIPNSIVDTLKMNGDLHRIQFAAAICSTPLQHDSLNKKNHPRSDIASRRSRSRSRFPYAQGMAEEEEDLFASEEDCAAEADKEAVRRRAAEAHARQSPR